MKKYIPSILVAILVGVVGYALTLTDVENEASTFRVKQVINANNSVIETNAANPSGTSATYSGTVTAEQLTSTDDITGAGALTMTDAAVESSFLGSVGIGTNNPTKQLHVHDGDGIEISDPTVTRMYMMEDDNADNNYRFQVAAGVFTISEIDASRSIVGTRIQVDADGRPSFGGLGALNYGSQADAIAAGVVTNGLYHTNGLVRVAY